MYLLIPCAGSGRRMGSDRNKMLLDLAGRPIVAWTLLAAEAAEAVDWIGLICQPHDRPELAAIAARLNLTKPLELITGGATRQASVYQGLRALPPEAQQVGIHDGARCLATPELLNRCAAALATCSGLIAAVPVKDTIKVVDGTTQQVTDTPDRTQLWAAQTPQCFDVATLRQCHDRGVAEGWEVTDDAALFERCGLPVTIVMGEETNLKVTTPQDLAIAAFILHQRGPL